MNIDKEEIIILIEKFKEKSLSWNEAETLLVMLVRDYESRHQKSLELSDERKDILGLRARMLAVETDVNDLKKGATPLIEGFAEEFSEPLKEQISPPTVLALKTIEELKAQLKEQAGETNQNLCNQVEELERIHDDLVKENTEITGEVKYLRHEMHEAKNSNQRLVKQNHRIDAANDRLVKQNDELRREVVGFEKTRRILDSNIKDLIKEAADANFRHQEIVRWHDPGEGSKNLMFDVEELRKENISLRREIAKKDMKDRLMGEIP